MKMVGSHVDIAFEGGFTMEKNMLRLILRDEQDEQDE